MVGAIGIILLMPKIEDYLFSTSSFLS